MISRQRTLIRSPVLKALQELVETIEQQRQSDARGHARVVAELQRRNEELQQRESALRAHLEQLDVQLQRSRNSIHV